MLGNLLGFDLEAEIRCAKSRAYCKREDKRAERVYAKKSKSSKNEKSNNDEEKKETEVVENKENEVEEIKETEVEETEVEEIDEEDEDIDDEEDEDIDDEEAETDNVDLTPEAIFGRAFAKIAADDEAERERKMKEAKAKEEAEQQLHPEDDESEVVEEATSVLEEVATPVVPEQQKEEVQNGPDFSNLQNAEVPLVRGAVYEESHNPALHQLNQNPDLVVETMMNSIINENPALQNLDRAVLNSIMKNSIEIAVAEIRKNNPGLTIIDSDMLNATLKTLANSMQASA